MKVILRFFNKSIATQFSKIFITFQYDDFPL